MIDSGAVPKFSLCDNGIAWFKEHNKWKEKDYTPAAGTFIFFDWPDENGNRDGKSDHVGIVERCENGIVYTIEGNSGDEVKENSYPVGYSSIMGYGVVS